MSPVYPDRMLAGCADGHHWTVDVAWTPLQLELDAEPCRHMQVPTPQSRYCSVCFLERRGRSPRSSCGTCRPRSHHDASR